MVSRYSQRHLPASIRRISNEYTDQREDVVTSDTKQEKKRLNILFGCISPILFLVFLRLYWMLFQFVYGTLFLFLLGKQFKGIIATVALVSSILFSGFTVSYIYKQFKKYLMEG
jgi:hypothetical protein